MLCCKYLANKFYSTVSTTKFIVKTVIHIYKISYIFVTKNSSLTVCDNYTFWACAVNTLKFCLLSISTLFQEHLL